MGRSVVCGDGLVGALGADQSGIGEWEMVLCLMGCWRATAGVLSYTEDSGTVESCYLLVGVSRLAGPHASETWTASGPVHCLRFLTGCREGSSIAG